MWPDNETVEDLIGFRVHADLIREVVTDPKLLPVTIGIFGDWGNGKTSIMQMLRRDLDPENACSGDERKRRENIAVLYFNGWLFEGYDDAKSALLSSVLEQLMKHQRFGPKVRDAATKLLKRVNWMRLTKVAWRNVAVPLISAKAAAFTGALPPQLAGTMALLAGDQSAPSSSGEGVPSESILKPLPADEQAMDLRTFREEFGKMLHDSNVESLVVLIDDLDRCSPETIIENLEAIKLFLNVERTAFVIGADPRIVRQAISFRYREAFATARQGIQQQDGDERIVDDYLEKLIQVPYRLPRLSPAEIETYITLLFCQRDLPPGDFTRCATKCEELRTANRFQSFGYARVKEALGDTPMPKSLDTALGIVSLAANLIAECLNGNPRQVKRFLNAYTLRRKLADVAKMENLKDDVLLKLMLLEYAELKRFLELACWQEEARGYPEKLRVFEALVKAEANGEGTPNTGGLPQEWDKPKLKRWLSLSPLLADVDLSDYFWLARDRLASTLTGLTMVPPVVRRAFEGLLNKGTRPLAAQLVKNFGLEEYAVLHDLLTRNLIRQPDALEGFDAFKALVEARQESAKPFADALTDVPVSKLSPSVPGELKLLIKTKQDLAPIFQPVFDHIQREPETRAAKALAGTTKKGR